MYCFIVHFHLINANKLIDITLFAKFVATSIVDIFGWIQLPHEILTSYIFKNNHVKKKLLWPKSRIVVIRKRYTHSV